MHSGESHGILLLAISRPGGSWIVSGKSGIFAVSNRSLCELAQTKGFSRNTGWRGSWILEMLRNQGLNPHGNLRVPSLLFFFSAGPFYPTLWLKSSFLNFPVHLAENDHCQQLLCCISSIYQHSLIGAQHLSLNSEFLRGKPCLVQ